MRAPRFLRRGRRARSGRDGRAVVLLYHRVGEPPFDPAGQAVTPARFAAHLELLRRRYRVRPLPDLVEDLVRGQVEDGSVAVSFDDGYADTLEVAAPLAAAAGVPFTVFVPMLPVLLAEPFWWDELAARVGGDGAPDTTDRFRRWNAELKVLAAAERRERLEAAGMGWRSPELLAGLGRPLTVPELRQLAGSPGVAIGGHTWSHPTLAALTPEEQRHELAHSRERLERLLDRAVDLLAYPFGKPADLAPETPGLARATGYRAAFTSRAGAIGAGSPPFTLPRLAVHDWPAGQLEQRLEDCLAAPLGDAA